MHFQVTRDGQTYGPYTLEDLKRYLASGNVLPTDLAKSETMETWMPVSTLLASAEQGQPAPPFAGGSGLQDSGVAGFANPSYGASGAAAAGFGAAMYGLPPAGFSGAQGLSGNYPPPPGLSWPVLLILDIVTLGLFQTVWNILVALWLRKVQPNATSIFFYVGALVLGLLQSALVVPLFLRGMHGSGLPTTSPAQGLSSLVGLAVFVVKLIARFSQRSSLQQHYGAGGPEPIGLELNPIMVFFFGGLYFQSHLSRIAELKKAAGTR